MTQPASPFRYEDYRAHSHRPGFDGLRGLGFLLVITAHIPSVKLFGYLQGWAAVWIFLAMSGYLVVMLLLREEAKAGRIAFGDFLVKRVFRIVPSYYATILIYWLACFALEPSPGDYESFSTKLPYYFGFLPEYANKVDYSIFTHAWTVGVEVKFYLFVPPVLFLLTKNTTVRVAITAIAAALLTAQGSFKAEAYCAILFGVMLALVLEHPRGYAVVARLTRVPAVVPVALVVAVIGAFLYTEAFTALALVAAYLLAYTILQPQKVARVLTWPPLAYLGQRSYGAYLLHFLILRIGYMIFGSDTAMSGLLAGLFCLVLTVPAAELLYRAVERPGAELGRRWLARKAPVAVP